MPGIIVILLQLHVIKPSPEGVHDDTAPMSIELVVLMLSLDR
jgi:hypothetical protein